MTWSFVRTRLAPMPCKGHGIAVIDGVFEGRSQPSAVLFGGMPSRTSDMTSDVFLLPLRTYT